MTTSNIVLTAPDTYTAEIDGTVRYGITPASWLYQSVLDAIAGGEPVNEQAQPIIPIPDLSFAQLLIGLVTEGWITEAQGDAWLLGVLPAEVTTLIASLQSPYQFPARARASRPSTVVRLDPLTVAMGQALGRTEEELDGFFRTYSEV